MKQDLPARSASDGRGPAPVAGAPPANPGRGAATAPQRWKRRFAALALGGALTLLGSLGLPLLVRGPVGQAIQVEFGIPGPVQEIVAAGLVCGSALLLTLLGGRALGKITAALEAHECNLAALRVSEARTAGIL